MFIERSGNASSSSQTKTNMDEDAENTFKILIATDNHLGYGEKDPVRGNDSFETFREILDLAVKEQVDFILLGGDLFHEGKPSLRALNTTISLLRQYCMGDKPCMFRMVSDQSRNFNTNTFSTLNTHDPNYNVSIPVFSIHGNHDDPAGDGNICPIDLLSSAGLINYFGKALNPDDIQIAPILLEKGTTKLALYGLGNLRDERLHRTFLRGNVKMLRPEETTDDWFNMFTLHQNRAEHGAKNFIPERFLNDFLDLILWGHEHECLIEPAYSANQAFFITQPGSSVATSLSEGESKTKHVGILSIRGRSFEMRKLKLQTVRPFIMDDVVLAQVRELDGKMLDGKAVETYLTHHVEDLLERIRDENKDTYAGQNKMLPLIRLRVEYSGGFSTFNPGRFGLKFVDRIANPRDVLSFYRSRRQINKKDQVDIINPTLPERLDPTKVDDLIEEYLKVQDLVVLSGKRFGKVLRHFVDKDDTNALPKFFNDNLKSTRSTAFSECQAHDLDSLKKELTDMKPADSGNNSKSKKDIVSFTSDEEENVAPLVARSSVPSSPVRKVPEKPIDDGFSDDSMSEDEIPKKPAAKSARSRTAASSVAKKKGKSKQLSSSDDENQDSAEVESESEEIPKPKLSRKRAPAAKATSSSTTKRAASKKKAEVSDDSDVLVISSDDEPVEKKPRTSAASRKPANVPTKSLKQASISNWPPRR